MLEVRALDAVYGRSHVLHGVRLAAREGEVVSLLGRNGAGKSTTLKAIMGLVRVTGGDVRFRDESLTGLPPHEISRRGIGWVPEDRRIFADLTVRENLLLAARAGDIDDARLRWVFGLFPALKKFWSLPARFLSGGQKQMLSIARAVIEPRKLFLIDEPTKGLAPAIVVALIECFAEVKRRGATILLVEQNFFAARELGDSVLVMDNGKIVHRGEMADLAADVPLQEKLLGLSLEAHQ